MALRRSTTQPDWLQKLKWHGEAWLTRLLVAGLKGRTHPTMRRGVRIARAVAEPILTTRIQTAAANLQRVYGDQLTTGQCQRLAAQSLDSFFLSCLESIIQPIGAELIQVEGDGLEDLFHCHKEGKGFIVGSLHLGCWDMGLRWLSRHLDNLSVVHRPAHNPYTNSILNGARSSNSQCHWISQRDAKAMLLKLRQGAGLVMMTDLYPFSNDLQGDFLGLTTHVPKGPLALSQKAGCPLFPVAHVREDDGRFRLICGKPLHPSSAATDLHERAGALGRWQEPWINAYAEQYYWINRRWRPRDGTGQRLRPTGALAERVLAKVNG
jgi:KDO2-lipid IV(A) lauroyltransferase